MVPIIIGALGSVPSGLSNYKSLDLPFYLLAAFQKNCAIQKFNLKTGLAHLACLYTGLLYQLYICCMYVLLRLNNNNNVDIVGS